jgi:mannose-1-phosphate guanylyltransferase
MTRQAAQPTPFHAVILAGGRGTRFWPRSRKRLPKQFLPVIGNRSLIQQTAERLSALAPPERLWVLTNEVLRLQALRQLPQIPRAQIIAEPVQRNTAPAIALAARLLLEQDPNAIMGVFPSDHYIANPAVFLRVLRRAVQAAEQDRLVVLGIPPRWPETGYGYIEFPVGTQSRGAKPAPVVRFREKPNLRTARRFVQAGNFYWNSGMFVWRARVILEAIERFMPATAGVLERLVPLADRTFRRSLAENYAACDDISIDYGVLERAKNIVGFPCPDFGWNDVGSWDAVYNLMPRDNQGNVSRSPIVVQRSGGSYVDAPGKLVALVGVKDLIVVDAADALLICHRSEAQKVSALVKLLEAEGLEGLL